MDSKRFSSICLFVISTSFLCIHASFNSIKQSSDPDWWKHAVVYQIYPRSFQDSDDDGVGDLKGIESRLSHFVQIGADTIWLSPIYESPMVDFGYDISNFTAIDPIFGTLQDFKDLVASAHEANIKVVLDFIPNHSSDQHAWFQKSLRKEEPYTDYYVWVDPKGYDEDGTPIPPSNWVARFRGSMWEYREERQQFYLHQYLVQQPDLNYRNPLVKEEMKNVLKLWMDIGVDGFRLDAVTKIWEDDRWLDEPESGDPDAQDENDWFYYDHIYTNNLPETRQVLKELYDFIKGYDDGVYRVVMLEAWMEIEDEMEYYNCGDFPFNFGFVNLEKPVSSEDVLAVITNWMDHIPAGKTPNWVLGNHDRKRLGTRVGEELIDLFNMISLGLPGVAVTYQGEELGMTDTNISYADTVDPWGCNCGPLHYVECSRDPVRTPMQWTGKEINAGFSKANETWLPVNENYPDVNADSEMNFEGSHLRNYMNLQFWRRDQASLKTNLTQALTIDNVLVFTRFGEYLDPLRLYAVLANFNSEETTIDISKLFNDVTSRGLIVFSTNRGSISFTDFNQVTMDAYEGLVLMALP